MSFRHVTRATPSDAPVASPRSDALRLWVILSRAHASVEAHAAAQAARHELTLAEFAILEVLHHRGPMLLGEVQRRILVTSGGITFLVDRLSKKGLVCRRDCAHDRRARYASLTAKGKQLIMRIFPEHAMVIERAMAGLSRAEQIAVSDALKRLGLHAAALDSDTEDGG